MKTDNVIAIQGIPGSFHHEVALQHFGEDCEIYGLDTFEQVAQAVKDGKASHGVMAIENSIAGAILPNYDLIDQFGLSITGEAYLPISHQLMCLPGQSIKEIESVKSHPMALLQCKTFLNNYPNLKPSPGKDTASVAREISENKLSKIAAIGSRIACEIYGLEILAEDIQTVKDNFTRFIFLSAAATKSSESHTKASVKVTIKNKPGALASLLTEIHNHGLDLSKIQSIPVIDKPWEYAFFLDMVFSNMEDFKNCMASVNSEFGEVKVFGAYKSGKK